MRLEKQKDDTQFQTGGVSGKWVCRRWTAEERSGGPGLSDNSAGELQEKNIFPFKIKTLPLADAAAAGVALYRPIHSSGLGCCGWGSACLLPKSKLNHHEDSFVLAMRRRAAGSFFSLNCHLLTVCLCCRVRAEGQVKTMFLDIS